jgi:hypothetical protein
MLDKSIVEAMKISMCSLFQQRRQSEKRSAATRQTHNFKAWNPPALAPTCRLQTTTCPTFERFVLQKSRVEIGAMMRGF